MLKDCEEREGEESDVEARGEAFVVPEGILVGEEGKFRSKSRSRPWPKSMSRSREKGGEGRSEEGTWR